MNKLSPLALLILFVCDLMAQPSTFLKTYNKGNSGYAIREVNSNNYVVSGGTDFYYNYHWMIMSPFASTNIHLFKTNITGNLTWEKIIGNIDSRTISTWLEPLTSGGFIITGHDNKDLSWPPDSNDVILIKTDTNGLIAWSKKFDSGKDELGFCTRETFDGGFIISGFHDAAPVSLAGNTYALLIKTDMNGNMVWSKKYQIAVRDFDTGEAFPCLVKQTDDSGFVIVGTTSGAHQADIFVLRTNASGALMWSKSYEHDNTMMRLSVGLDIIETSSGDFVIAASLDKDRALMQFNYPCILKINASGTLISAKLFDSNPVQMFQSGFSSVEEIPGDGFFFTGMGGYGGFGTQAQLLKTGANFNLEWSRVYSWDGIATMGSRSGRHTSDGGFIFTGKRQNAGSVLMKTNHYGLIPCKNPGLLVEIPASFLTISRSPFVATGINVSGFVLNTQISFVDTTTLCPVFPATLPIELLSFSAKPLPQMKVILEWETASETNNDFFVIEKSIDGNHFTSEGMIPGAGNSKIRLEYSYIDYEKEGQDVIYYRLKQIDYDGASTFSKTIPVHFNQFPYGTFCITPLPAEGYIHVSFQSGRGGKLSYTLTDILGKTIIQGALNHTAGLSFVNIDAANLARGLYYLTMTNHMQVITRKIMY